MDEALKRVRVLINRFSRECNSPYALALMKHLNYGKMLRSKLLLSISGDNEQAFVVCALLEMIHNASLLHDDVIDNATTRRGKASINAEFGNKNAIMLGDMLYSKAYFELCSINLALAKSVSSAVLRLSLGEIADVALSSSFHTNKMAYIQMCADKTAALIASAAECGAIIVGLDAKPFSRYGEYLGIAFQLIDDVLDISADSTILGKPNMSDFSEGKTTLPYMYLYECLSDSKKERLLSYFHRPLKKAESAWIKAQMVEYDILAKCIKEARKYASKALKAVKTIHNQKLKDIVSQMVERTF